MNEQGPVWHAFENVGELRLHRLHFGEGPRPVISLHGVTGHAWMWSEVAAHLRGEFPVVSLDLRGHGDSQWSASGSYRTDDHVADLSGVVDALDLEQVDLAGSSWGALVALGYAARNPDRVRKLAMVDVEPSFEQGETDVFPRPRSFADHAEAAAWERQATPHAPESMIEVMAAFGTRPGEDGGLHRKHDPYFFERWPFRADDRWEELRALELPVLVVHAEQSFVRGEVAERMAKETGNGRVVHIGDSGHLVPVEQPAVLAETLLGFFREG
jgi:pimeloyl-ACP methyl ester carboxylesterase